MNDEITAVYSLPTRTMVGPVPTYRAAVRQLNHTIRLEQHNLNSDFWPFGLKIGALVAPALANV